MLTNIKIILRWIARYWYPSVPYGRMSDFIDLWISLVLKWYKANGAIPTIKRIKAIRLTTTRYICSHPLMVNSDRVSVTKDGFPTNLISIKDLVDSKSPQALRFVLTCLGVSRAFPFIGEPDISSITDKFSGTIKTIDNEFIVIFVKDFCGHFNPLVERPTPFKSFLSMKAGPFGGPAILTSAISALRFSGINLWGLAGIGGDRFMEWVKMLKLSTKFDWNLFTKKLGNKSTDFRWGNRRFIRIDDPEAKVRIVGCYDYISQLALTPFSEWAFDALRKFPQDRTYTQDPVIKDKRDSESYHSLDLSSATDRFPISLQVQLLTEIAGPGFAGYWKNLMVAEPFVHQGWETVRLERKPFARMVKYEVGQPMGARSSWAAFTLSHHLVVQFAAYKNGMYPFKEYILLGDDVVIYNDIVAETYTSLIRDLGVNISTQKSHVSEDTYEFAKRWFQNNIEISPVPINGFVSNWHNPKLLYSQLLELIYKGRGPKSIISSIDLMANLIGRLTKPSTEHAMDPIPNGGFFRQDRAYSPTQLKYSIRSFSELQLVYRNTKEMDEERTRAFMADATKDNDYIMPTNSVSLNHEWIRAGSGVVNGMAMSCIRDLNIYYRKYKEAYILATSHEFQVGTVDFGWHPLTLAIYASVKRYHLMNKAMGYTTDLTKQLETVTLLNLDKLAKSERNSEELIFTFSTFAAKLRRQMKDDPDLYIAKARTMQFGRSLFDIQLAMQREFPHLKAGNP